MHVNRIGAETEAGGSRAGGRTNAKDNSQVLESFKGSLQEHNLGHSNINM